MNYRFNWRSYDSKSDHSVDGELILVMQYNTLLNRTAIADHYPYTREEDLEWDKRGNAIIDHINQIKPDILALEEVDQQEFFDQQLNELYQGVHYLRSYHDDGNSIYFLKSRFTLKETYISTYVDCCPNIISDRGYIILYLYDTIVSTDLFVVCTHLYWDSKNFPSILIDECAQLCKSIQEKSTLKKCDNIIVCGDFNSVPHSEVYKCINNYRINNICSLLSSYSSYLEAANGEVDIVDEPLYTSVNCNRSETIDYIFYSKNKFIPVSLLELPSVTDYQNANYKSEWYSLYIENRKSQGKVAMNIDQINLGLPNSIFPSDHFPIAVKFSYKI